MQKRDQIKIELCKKNQIILIVIPYTRANSVEDICNLISNEYSKITKQNLSINIDGIKDIIKINQKILYTDSRLNDLQQIAKSKGGKCLSSIYIDCKTKLKFECKNKHQWSVIPSSIKRGMWCPYCSKHNLIDPIGELQAIINSKGGKLISTEYINEKTYMKIECKEGHQWEAQPSNIKQGKWCPICSRGITRSIKRLEVIVNQKQGYFNPNDYINNYTEIEFECDKGHKWRTLPSHIQQGSWCPKCNNKNRSERMKQEFKEGLK